MWHRPTAVCRLYDAGVEPRDVAGREVMAAGGDVTWVGHRLTAVSSHLSDTGAEPRGAARRGVVAASGDVARGAAPLWGYEPRGPCPPRRPHLHPAPRSTPPPFASTGAADCLSCTSHNQYVTIRFPSLRGASTPLCAQKYTFRRHCFRDTSSLVYLV